MSLLIDVRMVDFSFKCNLQNRTVAVREYHGMANETYLRRLEWVFCREVDLNSECAFVVRGVVLEKYHHTQGEMTRVIY